MALAGERKAAMTRQDHKRRVRVEANGEDTKLARLIDY